MIVSDGLMENAPEPDCQCNARWVTWNVVDFGRLNL